MSTEIRYLRRFAVLVLVLACRSTQAVPADPARALDRALDLETRGRLVLGELLTVAGGERIWQSPPGGAKVDCFGPCFYADSAYLLKPPLPKGLSQVVVTLDQRGHVFGIVAIHSMGSTFSDVFRRWRRHFGPPSCGGGTSQQLPTWIDSTTSVVFFGDEKWDSNSPMILALLDRTNPWAAKLPHPVSCAPGRN